MIVNEYVLMELNQQRRAEVAGNIAAVRAARKDRRRPRVSALRRRTRTVTSTQPVTTTIVLGTGSAAH